MRALTRLFALTILLTACAAGGGCYHGWHHHWHH